MTSDQLRRVATACVDRCRAGNSWPPDFAEFMQLVADCGGGGLGITTADVLSEFKRWRENEWRYGSADRFPWRQPVLYHICIELRREGVERNLTHAEHEKRAAALLQRWEKKTDAGYSVPPVRAQLAAPVSPSGPTPAQALHAEYLRRQAAGWFKK
ncbi:replication protein P [Erwinia sp. OPT-41]|uniref:Replication protein P n=1 Tax=Erwinia plantamica TaxID=3237104 RepID=A0ABW7CLK5_9GAMM